MTAEAPDAADAAGVDVEPVGVDEMVRQERIRSIFDARQVCRQKRTEAKKHASVGESDKASVVFRSPLESYVREVEPLFKQTPEGKTYWDEHNFGQITLKPEAKPCPGNTDKWSLASNDDAILNGPPSGRKIPVRGVNSLFELSPPITAEFTVSTTRSGLDRGTTAVTENVWRQIPMSILDEMFAVTNAYLSELGFGIDIQEGEKKTKLDDDLINEVEKWRRENL